MSISQFTKSLIDETQRISTEAVQDEGDFIEVSKTVSFFAIAYEKIRNVIEFKDDHIIRRNAINRIVRRRLAFNPSLTNESLSIAKEIVWAGYVSTNRIPEQKIDRLDKIIRWYIGLRDEIVKAQTSTRRSYYVHFVYDLLVSQIEELFAEKEFSIRKFFTFYIYQVLNPQIEIQGLDESEKNLYFYIATEKVLLKSDVPYLRFHLMKLISEQLLRVSPESFDENIEQFKRAFSYIDSKIEQPINQKVIQYLRNQRPAFLIFQEFIMRHQGKLAEIMDNPEKFKGSIEAICRDKYENAKEKLRRAGFRSIIYIFLTKMMFVLAAEYPLMLRLGEEIDYMTLGINALFPVLLMVAFVALVEVPDDENTARIYEKIKAFVYGEKMQIAVFRDRKKAKRGFIAQVLFWLFYVVTFGTTFYSIDIILDMLNFQLMSKVIFFFFVTAVCFFGYRVRQIAVEYIIKEKDSVLTPVFDFFMIPLVSVGKWLSSEISKINVLIFVFDFLIEAPFKVLFEVIEEWIGFLKHRKQEML